MGVVLGPSQYRGAMICLVLHGNPVCPREPRISCLPSGCINVLQTKGEASGPAPRCAAQVVIRSGVTDESQICKTTSSRARLLASVAACGHPLATSASTGLGV